jgi:ribosomal protein S18 acetylase RimI-like enzyme
LEPGSQTAGTIQLSMEISQIEDKELLTQYFRRDINLHFYSLGDLGDFYWPNTIYYGIKTRRGVDQVVLLYQGKDPPTFLALFQPGVFDQSYLKQLIPLIPDDVYGHLSPGLEKAFSKWFSIINHGPHFKMGLNGFSQMREVNIEKTELLMAFHMDEIQTLYQQSYPNNAFDPKMLQTGLYYGYRHGGHLVSIAGVHVFSPSYRVAALGNIATHPDYRNQGLARTVTARLCLELKDKVDFIGLNVKVDNAAAVHLYQSLGFNISSKYGEFSLKKRD